MAWFKLWKGRLQGKEFEYGGVVVGCGGGLETKNDMAGGMSLAVMNELYK